MLYFIEAVGSLHDTVTVGILPITAPKASDNAACRAASAKRTDAGMNQNDGVQGFV